MNEETELQKVKLPNWFLVLREVVNQRYVTLAIYASVALFTATGEVLEKEEAVEILGKKALFYYGAICYIASATLLGIKMVMSDSWAKEQGEKK